MKNNLPIGIAAALLSALFYSTQTAIIKLHASSLPPVPVIIFFQSIVSLILILPIVFKNGLQSGKKTITTQRLPLHFLRSIFSQGISYLLFSAVLFIPLVNAMLLSNTAPLIVPFIAYLFLSQQINHKLWLPILIGYTGVVLVLHPDARLFNPAAFLALGAAVSLGSTMLTVRKLSSTESTETIAFYFFLLSSMTSGIIASRYWIPLNTTMLLTMLVIGVLYFLTQYSSTLALRYANAQLVSALYYSNIIYATLLSYFIWHTLPTTMTFLGMTLIIIGGIYCIAIEHATLSRQRILLRETKQYAGT